jgi:phosphatidate cytidylyltransferase
MSNLAQRLITGSIFVVVLVGCIWFSPWTLLVLCLAITVLGLSEFYKLSLKANAEPQSSWGILVGAIVITTVFFQRAGGYPWLGYIILPLVFITFFIELFRKKQNPIANISWTFGGLIYIALPIMLLISTFTPYGLLRISSEWISEESIEEVIGYKPEPILTIFILIWISDSMAYVCGRLFGKHKLWERISPKKTWEGFIGGLLFSGVSGHFLGLLWLSDHDHNVAIMWTIIAVVISITGMLGDLVESLFKRSIDVKDSGRILPGHGGILDRFDALFLSVPFALTVYWIYPNL